MREQIQGFDSSQPQVWTSKRNKKWDRRRKILISNCKSGDKIGKEAPRPVSLPLNIHSFIHRKTKKMKERAYLWLVWWDDSEERDFARMITLIDKQQLPFFLCFSRFSFFFFSNSYLPNRRDNPEMIPLI